MQKPRQFAYFQALPGILYWKQQYLHLIEKISSIKCLIKKVWYQEILQKFQIKLHTSVILMIHTCVCISLNR